MMKALVLQDYHNLVYEDRPVPEFGPEEALVRIKASGICGSDVHGMDGSTGRRRPPVIMGHEAAGVIAQVGAKVRSWKVGDRVTFDSTIYCGKCWFCQRGQVNLCDNRRVFGVSCSEYRQHGTFAEYVAVPQRILYRLPENLPFEQASLVEPLAIAVHAVHRVSPILNASAVVLGVGMIGLLVVQVLQHEGCGLIVAVDVDPHHLELARKMGAHIVLEAQDQALVDRVRSSTQGRGVDVAFEAVGIASTVKTALEVLRKDGKLCLIGNLSPEVVIPLQSIVTREISLAGSCASNGEYPVCLDLMARGDIDVRPLISATAPLSEGPVWFRRLYDREGGLMKVVLIP